MKVAPANIMRDILKASLERRLEVLMQRNAPILDDAERAVANPDSVTTSRMSPMDMRDARELARILAALDELR